MTDKRLPGFVLFCLLAAAACFGEQTYASGLYTISYPDTFKGIEEMADACNALRSSFNELLRLDYGAGTAADRIVILADKDSFDAYVSQRIGEVRGQYLLLRYPDPARSELVLYPRANADGYSAFSGPALDRQLFLQYLYGSVAEPPLWIRDGFQIFFSNIGYDAQEKKVVRDANEPWLETAKEMQKDSAKKLNSEAILSAMTGTYDSTLLYPQVWAFVSFLVNSEKPEYQRFLHESALLLSGDGAFNGKTQKENTELVRERFIGFNDPDRADADFSLWLSGQHTFNDYVQSGVTSYNAGDYGTARGALESAVKMRNRDPLATYYLGLVAYARKEYPAADGWYRKALEYGGDVSTVNWALGLNAYADKRYAESRVYLETAKAANPARYEKRVDEIVSSMPK